MRADYKEFDHSKKILITGAAGFIGFHLSRRLLREGCECSAENKIIPQGLRQNDYLPEFEGGSAGASF